MPVGMRRQNHSCDQCRKAKRACDAPSLREAARRGSVPESWRSDSDNNDFLPGEFEYRSCSYCLKTNKHCTLDWARSQLQAAQTASAARSTEHRRAKRPRTDEQGKAAATTAAAAAAMASGSSSASPSSSTASESKPTPTPRGLQRPQLPQPPQSSQRQSHPQQPQQPHQPIFPSPPPTMTPTSTMRTTSELGDAGASASMPPAASAVNLSFWNTTNPSSFQNIPNLDSFNAMTPHDHHQHHHTTFNGNVELSSLGFNGASSIATDGTASLMGFDTIPVTTSELVTRPAFHSIAPEQSALWGMLPAQAGLDVNSNQQPITGLTSPEVFSSTNGEDEDASSSSAIADSFSMHRSSFSQQQFPGARRMSSYSTMVSPAPTSAVEFMMATRFNNHSISENLLQIYHDVLEHNLTCWITEETCPYNIWARPAKQKQIKAMAAGIPHQAPIVAVGGRRSWEPHQTYKSQFGPNWSNRVYRRVTKLDKIAQDTGIMRLSRSQNQASQKALHLVIMAFATQWAQGSQRQREAYTTGFAQTNQASAEEFDRSIQRSLWHQARAALQDCADIESYRVVCAELIFGLTQRPWEEFEFAELELTTSSAQFSTNGSMAHSTGEPATFAEARRKREAILSKLSEVIQKDGPPIFIERAARKMHALKSKFDNYELGFLGDEFVDPKDVTDTGSKITTEDGQTVGLLFWMAAMFDTISASLSERPAVLADDESQHEAAEHEQMFPGANFHSSGSEAGSSEAEAAINIKRSNRWRIDLFIQDNPERMSHQYHYPCSYEDAAHNITHATPVKVLLYRQVLYLQNMLRKPYLTKGRPTEEIVSETLMIYRYWNTKYGAFFRELLQHYPTVPSRIRGWFVCILAHWHLGALMLADVLELVDQNRVGLEENRQMRLTSHTVANIRRTSAIQLSDLARVATPLMPDSDTDPTMPDFHFAVREGTILTEPWTILLIRAFSKASIIHLREADEIRQQGSPDLLGHDSEACRESLRRSEDCIQALWYLGKKSDMARNVAVVLFRAMNVGNH
ncbi:hypothetical protein F503_03618 [Ophiostoma piceae UAMH 11346]|uniref:Uncharacterized protein n=1 Tax=Ophiostoma piceae (strain UAMH 11346) TaxID=1262450 RepID=S3BYJ6_OPHP1|nr:hypothetical protein F503_03618 [Ophiostoma piceae UAMH 11346]